MVFVTVFSLIAGGMDTVTGLLLILMPGSTLSLMKVSPEGHPPALIGFIGAFVLANGSLYLWGFWLANRQGSMRVLKHAWLATAWVRICVGLTTSVFILREELSASWISVPVTDLLIAAIQCYCLAAGKFPDDD
jgi:divalent metal cation (Fe/Co/Zn/Cd) transporter